MNKSGLPYILFWLALAVISFIGTFWTPVLFFRICGWAFFGLNFLVGVASLAMWRSDIRITNETKKLLDENVQLQSEDHQPEA